MGTDCNFFNMGTIVYVIVAGGPVLKGIQGYRVDLVPSPVFMYNIKKDNLVFMLAVFTNYFKNSTNL